jgi:2-polyprenyl-6-hydroxyphenyl methylase/3-demethylubiquinone-9 3-methyltransferase
MGRASAIDGYLYADSGPTTAHSYLLPSVKSIIDREQLKRKGLSGKLFDLGCGNGSVCAAFARLGYEVIGVDPSETGVNQAMVAYPELRIEIGSAYDDLAAKYGRFDYVISLEVVEHVFSPREYAKTLFDLVDVGGIAIISTPYHGYLKNLALAVFGRMDEHFTALWDCGHIKFWSIRTLTALLGEAGFRQIEFRRVGRVPQLAKSMIAVCRR